MINGPTEAPALTTTHTEERQVQEGDTVLVLLDAGVRRPLIVTRQGKVPLYASQSVLVVDRHEYRVSGVILCEPEDHATPVARGYLGSGQTPADPARVHGRPDRLTPFLYAEHLAPGMGLGQWITRPTQLPGA